MLDTFTFFQGDPFVWHAFAKNEDGSVLDLTGVIGIKVEISKLTGNIFSPSPDSQKSLSSGVVIIDASTGAFDVTYSKTDTLSLDGRFRVETEITLSSGNPITNASIVFDIQKTLIK